jgi:hypothetical protein
MAVGVEIVGIAALRAQGGAVCEEVIGEAKRHV